MPVGATILQFRHLGLQIRPQEMAETLCGQRESRLDTRQTIFTVIGATQLTIMQHQC